LFYFFPLSFLLFRVSEWTLDFPFEFSFFFFLPTGFLQKHWPRVCAPVSTYYGYLNLHWFCVDPPRKFSFPQLLPLKFFPLNLLPMCDPGVGLCFLVPSLAPLLLSPGLVSPRGYRSTSSAGFSFSFSFLFFGFDPGFFLRTPPALLRLLPGLFEGRLSLALPPSLLSS